MYTHSVFIAFPPQTLIFKISIITHYLNSLNGRKAMLVNDRLAHQVITHRADGKCIDAGDGTEKQMWCRRKERVWKAAVRWQETPGGATGTEKDKSTVKGKASLQLCQSNS